MTLAMESMLFSLDNSIGFGGLSITDNPTGTATFIKDTTDGDLLLALVRNVSAADLTAADFMTI